MRCGMRQTHIQHIMKCHAWPPMGLRGYKYLDEKVAARDFEAQDRSITLIVDLDRLIRCLIVSVVGGRIRPTLQ